MLLEPNEVWDRHPEAEIFILDIVENCSRLSPTLESLEKDLLKHSSTRLFDWIDHVFIGYSDAIEHQLETLGFSFQHASSDYRIFYHPNAQLPRIVLNDQQGGFGVAISLDSIPEFLLARGTSGWIEGKPFSPFRRCCISKEKNVWVWVIERRGTEYIEPTYPNAEYTEHYLESTEKWQSRNRNPLMGEEQEALFEIHRLATEIVDLLGEDTAASLILDCERKYWQLRNTAGQWQKYRQDRLGMGWGNHDHHTFRSSRKLFPALVRLFEILGFHCRERFYAGQEAGWGAQVMENPRAKLVLFLDVDLAPNELDQDFSHHPLMDLDHLGTIGLWCRLHGDSILQSGMHHLEAQFSFENLKQDLSVNHIRMMEPFSNFSFLKQAFTEGEVWQVNPKRIEELLKENKISVEQAQKFLRSGAIGSHLENLQRREGYKGFNQKNVSHIIKETDPRH